MEDCIKWIRSKIGHKGQIIENNRLNARIIGNYLKEIPA